MIHTGGIDLDAAYQRDVVWSESKMVGLIQSLFLVSHPILSFNFCIPLLASLKCYRIITSLQ